MSLWQKLSSKSRLYSEPGKFLTDKANFITDKGYLLKLCLQ